MNNYRCPQCGENVLVPKVISNNNTDDPIVWCSDMGHWAGRLSECDVECKEVMHCFSVI